MPLVELACMALEIGHRDLPYRVYRASGRDRETGRHRRTWDALTCVFTASLTPDVRLAPQGSGGSEWLSKIRVFK